MEPGRRDLRRQAAAPSPQGDAARRQLLEMNRSTVYPRWLRMESRHFILFTPSDSPVAKRMQDFLDGRESAYRRIATILQVEVDERIKIYAYSSSRSGEKLLGRPLAFTLPAEQEIHMRWDQEPGHELTHVLAWSMNRSGSGQPFLEEGLAVALSSHPGSPQAAAGELLARGVLPDLADLIPRFHQHRNGYVAAGSFIALLLEEGGADLVRSLYTEASDDLEVRLEAATGQSLAQLQAWWETSLAAVEPVTREPVLEALSLLRLGEVVAAIAVLERQRRDLPDNPVFEFALAQALQQHGDLAASAAAYRRVLSMPLPYRLAWMKRRAQEALEIMATGSDS